MQCAAWKKSAKYYERITHIEQLLLIQNLSIDTAALREACTYGIPDLLRPLCWRLFLGGLPKERQEWLNVLKKQRAEYLGLVDNLIVRPGLEEAQHEQQTVDHPLASGAESQWDGYFKDNEVLTQIDKDVRRLRPEIDFFQRNTAYPLRSAARIHLSERINRENLSSEVPEAKLPCQSFLSSSNNNNNKAKSSAEDVQDVETHWQVVERILFVYSKVNSGIKYVQGMNEIVGPIYYVFANDPDEEWRAYAESDTFYCFQNLMTEIKDNFIRTLDSSDCGIESTLRRFHDVFAETDPQLHRHVVDSLSIKPQFYAFRWISLLLSQEFSLPDVIILWDTVFAHSNRIETVQYICLAMLESLREELLQGDFSHDVRLLQNYPSVDLGQLVLRAIELRERRNAAATSDSWEDHRPRQNSSGFWKKERFSALINSARDGINSARDGLSSIHGTLKKKSIRSNGTLRFSSQ
ncbi:TBC domain-containing protein c [Aphelenchoides avenae]|nr:TBC domain-containing protein c [Aphelenchus avenae]